MFDAIYCTDRFVEVRHATRNQRRYRIVGHRTIGSLYDHLLVVLDDGWDARAEVFVADRSGEIANWFPLLAAPTYHELTARLSATTGKQWAAAVDARPPSATESAPGVLFATSSFRGRGVDAPPPSFRAAAALIRHALLVAGIPSGDRLEGAMAADEFATAVREARKSKREVPVPEDLWKPLLWTPSVVDHILDRLGATAEEALASGYADVAWTAGF
jgi:hypothetical protein